MILQKTVFAALALVLAATGCAYKIEIQQGSDALLEHVDELQTGMTQEEVVGLLGPPSTPRLFRKNIWIYTYQHRAAGFIDDMRLRSVELVFDDSGVLQQINMLRDDYSEEQESGG